MSANDHSDRNEAVGSVTDPTCPRNQAWEAFQRDYPKLTQEHAGEWVAYQGAERLGFGRTKTELYQECLRRGLPRDEFLVCCIEPAVDELYFGASATEWLRSQQ